jgi:hypothetical protein
MNNDTIDFTFNELIERTEAVELQNGTGEVIEVD